MSVLINQTHPDIIRLKAFTNILEIAIKGNPVRQQLVKTIQALLRQSNFGQQATEVSFSLRCKTDSGNPKEIKENFITFTLAIQELLNNLFCTSGNCTVESHYYDEKSQVESCIFRYTPN